MAFVPVEGHARDTEYPHYIGDLGTLDSQLKGKPLLCQSNNNVTRHTERMLRAGIHL